MLQLISCLYVGSIWPYGVNLLSHNYGCTNSKYGNNGSLGNSSFCSLGKVSQQQGCHSNPSILVPFLTVLL